MGAGNDHLDLDHQNQGRQYRASKQRASSEFFGDAVQDLVALRAVPEGLRLDKQMRFVEDATSFYVFDLQGTSGGEIPDSGSGRWYQTPIATGFGDMFKATYDIGDSGVVDDAEKLGGVLPTDYARKAIDSVSGLPVPVHSTRVVHVGDGQDAEYANLTAAISAINTNVGGGLNVFGLALPTGALGTQWLVLDKRNVFTEPAKLVIPSGIYCRSVSLTTVLANTTSDSIVAMSFASGFEEYLILHVAGSNPVITCDVTGYVDELPAYISGPSTSKDFLVVGGTGALVALDGSNESDVEVHVSNFYAKGAGAPGGSITSTTTFQGTLVLKDVLLNDLTLGTAAGTGDLRVRFSRVSLKENATFNSTLGGFDWTDGTVWGDVTWAANANDDRIFYVDVIGTITDNSTAGILKTLKPRAVSKAFLSDQMNSPTSVGDRPAAIDNAAPAASDSLNGNLTVRLFDAATEEAVTISCLVPSFATRMIVTYVSRPEGGVTGAGDDGVAINVYERGIPSGGGQPEAWSSAIDFNAIAYPVATAPNAAFQYDTDSKTLVAWGLTAGQIHQFMFSRDDDDVADELVGDMALLAIFLEFL